jgi:hypothetical protein
MERRWGRGKLDATDGIGIPDCNLRVLEELAFVVTKDVPALDRVTVPSMIAMSSRGRSPLGLMRVLSELYRRGPASSKKDLLTQIQRARVGESAKERMMLGRSGCAANRQVALSGCGAQV